MGEHGLAVDVRCDVAHDEVASRAGVVVGDIMAVKSVETVGSTLKRAVGFALFSLLVRQVVLLCTSKEPLSNVQVRILGPDLNSTQTVTTMSLPAWLEDFESTNARRGSGSSGKHSHNFSSLDERAFQKYLLEQESEWKNGLAFCLLPETFKEKVKLDTWPLFARAWLRSFIFANLIYLGLGLTWAYYIYNVYGFYLFPKGNMPKIEDAAEQIKVSLGSLPLYSMLPAVCEYIVEQGWTLAYVRIDQYGWPMFLCCLHVFRRVRSLLEPQASARPSGGVRQAALHSPQVQQGKHAVPLCRLGLPPTGWNLAGDPLLLDALHHSDARLDLRAHAFRNGGVDNQHSRLRGGGVPAYHGGGLPHHSPHDLQAQLRTVLHVLRLVVRNLAVSRRGHQSQEREWQGSVGQVYIPLMIVKPIAG